MDYKDYLSYLEGLIEAARTERTTAGTRYRLMGLAADVTELAEKLEREVLERVRHEAVLDVDADLDFEALAAEVLTWELEEEEEDPLPAPQDSLPAREPRFAREGAREGLGAGPIGLGEQVGQVNEQVGQLNKVVALVNEALGVLSSVLADIGTQMARRHSDEEYERLYEAEKRRYMVSGTAHRARQTFEEWKEINGELTAEDIEDYRLEKVLHMFEKGVLNERVEHIQRAKRYLGELDLEQLDSGLKVTKTVYHHYAALRKLVDWKDGALVVNPARVGQHFYASRHEKNAKQNRSLLLKYMHKVWLVQQEARPWPLPDASGEAAVGEQVPLLLRTERASEVMGKLVDAGMLTAAWQPQALSGAERGLVAKAVSEQLGISEVWQVFGELWGVRSETLRRYFNNALEQRKSLDFQDKLKRILR